MKEYVTRPYFVKGLKYDGTNHKDVEKLTNKPVALLKNGGLRLGEIGNSRIVSIGDMVYKNRLNEIYIISELLFDSLYVEVT